ncbi:MAG TPA: hypothetical protein VFG33_35725 [Kribbella sp.]|uniref:hypothetical protein n=1 Tax=Kribbella sp. TaxID=1871183 RepID=UPI002D7A33A0|nr:hypothetical protein [Kribbella sp.]HET6298774.1 hypothetical protein [Kribbella sp.]
MTYGLGPSVGSYQLGRKSPDRTRPNVLLKRVRGATLSPPAATDWGTSAMNTMAMNDQLGCCTISDKVHVVTSQQYFGQGRTVVIPDTEVLKAYRAVSGYVPGKPRTDVGATLQDAFDYARKVGFSDGSVTHRIEAFAQIDAISNRGAIDHDLIKTCIDSFGHVAVGMVFPDFAMDQFGNNQVWDWSSRVRYREEGGHDIPLVGYGGTGAGAYYDCWTWGRRQRITVPFFERFFEEFWTSGEKDWQRLDGSVPNGIDGQAAQVEFERLIGEGPGWDGAPPAPDPDPVPEPVPGPDGPEPPPIDDQLVEAFESFSGVFSAWRGVHGK